ncbi:MAG TPA: DUF3108 domain-containing protein [Dongiaceae bacterium]|nr:DUF3108 domain-containing protein [Dongiaceae bacterium]
MSAKKVGVFAAIFAAALGAGAFFLLHNASRTTVKFTPEPAPASATPSAPAATTEPASPAKTSSSPATPPGFLPRAGEVLNFSANVAKVNNVATLQLSVIGEKELAGHQAWHLQALAHTQNPLRMVFELDDQFDSYSTASDFAGLQYEMRLSEKGQKVQSVQRLNPAAGGGVHVPPGTRDPLGTMQYLRSLDWSKSPQVSTNVFEGRKVYQVQARKTGSAEVTVPAGKFSTTAVEIKVFDNGTEMNNAHFTLYLAKDAARTPVLLEAVLPFAEARVQLMSRQ